MVFDTILSKSFVNHIELVDSVRNELSPQIKKAGLLIGKAILNENKILLIGNGGSAADAQHIAAEFTGRFVAERNPLPAVALTTNSSAITAISNDYGYNQVFSRQIMAIGNKGDVLIAISTSGNSPNIIEAVYTANSKGLTSICLAGKDGGSLKENCEVSIVVPSKITARIQEMHILIGHIFCEYVDSIYIGVYDSSKGTMAKKTFQR